MAWEKHRKIEFDYEPDHKYPYVVTAWCNVGGINCGDRFTEEVAEVLISSVREDGIKVVVTTLEGKK